MKEFRPQQLRTINAILDKNDVILVAPTGGGKSLCFQLPAVTTPGLTVVVSPLISLMEDQLVNLRKYRIEAAVLSTNTDKAEEKSVYNRLTNHDFTNPLKLLYITPERMSKSKRFMTALQKCYLAKHLDRFAIDEVHCCSQWGHDFRPDYKFLGSLKTTFPDVPILGVTATGERYPESVYMTECLSLSFQPPTRSSWTSRRSSIFAIVWSSGHRSTVPISTTR